MARRGRAQPTAQGKRGGGGMGKPRSAWSQKNEYEIEAKHGAFFTGGLVQWSSSGEEMLCQCGGVVHVLDVQQGRIKTTLGQIGDVEDEDTVTTFTLSPDNEAVITSHKSGLFRLWNWRDWIHGECNNSSLHFIDGSVQKMWKSIHKGPVARLALNPTGWLMASGGSDSSVRIWDLQHQACTLNLRGIQGVVSVLEFHPEEERSQVFAAADDTTICAWDVKTGERQLSLAGHFSKVTALAFHKDFKHMISCGRDKVVIVWDIVRGVKERTLPVYESLECVVILPTKFSLPGHTVKGGIHIATAGERVMVWVEKEEEVQEQLQEWNEEVIVWVEKEEEVQEQLQEWNEEVMSDGALKSHIIRVIRPPSDDYMWDNSQELELHAGYSILCNFSHELKLSTGMVSGVLRVWDALSGREIYSQENSLVSKATEEGGLAITQLLFNEQECSFAIITVDHNIILHKLKTFTCQKQLIGFSDEILDIVLLGADNSHLAVATNSTDIKLYKICDMGCQLLRGHTDLVLALAVTPSNTDLLLSSGKDNTVRMWLMEPLTNVVTCIGVGSRHTESVGSIALSSLSASYFVSASQDSCIKLWDVPKTLKPGLEVSLTPKFTERAHEKDINCVSVSPNDKIIASGSQDKTTKLWSADDLSLLGVLRGHRRGVWCVRFSPVDMVVLTTSADCLIKLWSIGDLTCIKCCTVRWSNVTLTNALGLVASAALTVLQTLEGHSSSVLRAEFLSRGMQLITTGADGLLKLWSIKSSECVATFDHHNARVWALAGRREIDTYVSRERERESCCYLLKLELLAVSKNEDFLVSGGSDSELVLWRDVTLKKQDEARKVQEKLILQEQELANLLKADQLLTALKLALTLDRPLQVLRIVQGKITRQKKGRRCHLSALDSSHIFPLSVEVIKKGKAGLEDTIRQLRADQKESLLKCASVWNTSSKNCHPAQLVISILLDDIAIGELKTPGLSSFLEGVIPYTERHFNRLTQLLQDLYFLQYTEACMQRNTM
uniref:U3 small nucleolar RNA-associated protein 13 C-terminal domain-containing protein n=1 Tax=Timema shepardi TaxID=629360 RepID=A0A7R9B276_TIMSH|nr:unnamed protein product [Timema shepardi]